MKTLHIGLSSVRWSWIFLSSLSSVNIREGLQSTVILESLDEFEINWRSLHLRYSVWMEPARLTKFPVLFSPVLGMMRGDWFSLQARKYISVFCCETGGLLFALSILRILTVNTGHARGPSSSLMKRKKNYCLLPGEIFLSVFIFHYKARRSKWERFLTDFLQ